MKTRRVITKYLLVAALFISTGFYTIAEAADWPNWRGPNYNGVSNEKDWDPLKIKDGVKPLWQKSVGIGFSTISVSDGRAYTMGNTGVKGKNKSKHRDIVFCFDAETGKEIWKHSYLQPLDPKYYEGGSLATPTINGGKVYTISKDGLAFCLDAKTGDVAWQKDISKEFGIKRTTWGHSGSPVVIDNMVIYNAGSLGVALNKDDGSLIWQGGKEPGGYATAVPFMSGDQKCIAMFSFSDIIGLDAATGKELWRYTWKTKHDVNAADPIIIDNKIFISSGYGIGCSLIEIENGKAIELWRNKNMQNKMNGSVLWKGNIYGVDESGELRCLDFKTGGLLWAQKGFGMGSLMIADGKLIVLGEKGNLVIAKATADGYQAISEAKILSPRCWSVPVLAGGRIYARNAAGVLVCLDVSKGAEKKTEVVSARGNWPQWHGPNRDNKSTETGLLKKWPKDGPELLWSTDGLGAGYSTVSIADGTIYTTGTVDKGGVLFALDMNGKLKWKQPYGAEWTKSYSGARSTPTVDQGSVYVISGMGAVSCFDAKTGNKKWTVDAFNDFKGKTPRFGVAESPLIVGDFVICTPGGKKASIVALDKKTGETVWASESLDEKSAYCSPLLIERGGRRIIVTMLEDSIVGVDAETGKILWSDKFGKNKYGVTPATPLYSDGCIYRTSGYDDGSVMYELSADGNEITRKWTDEVLDNHHGGVVEVGGYIYGTNWKGNPTGDWVCLDWETGKVMYETGWIGKGSVTYADGMLYCYEEKQGTVGLAEATAEKFEIISSFKVPMGTGEHWAHPVIYDGRLYIRHGEALMAYDIKDQLSSVGWRNDSTGSYPEATVANEWSDEKNIIFKTPLPGVSNASPILINDKIFLCSEPATLICADAKNGKILWQKDNHYFDTLGPEEAVKARELLKESENHEAQLKELEQELEKVKEKLSKDPNDAAIVKEVKDKEVAIEALNDTIKKLGAYNVPKTHGTNGYSSPTPTTDGKYVYTIFGTGVAVCYDMDGNRIWSKFVETPTHNWGHSASPLLIDGKLIVHIKNLIALNSRTGQILWEAESATKWGSPVHAKIGDVDVVVTPGGDIVRAQDGKILAGKVSSLDYAAPVYAGDRIYFIESGGKALQLPEEVTEQMNPTVLWETTPKKDRYYASSLVHDGLIYAITKSNVFSVIDAGTGQVVYEKELDLGKGTVYPSVILAGDRLFVSNDNGTTLVLQPGREYVEIAKNKIEGFRSTPLLRANRMYIRSLGHLYCIGN